MSALKSCGLHNPAVHVGEPPSDTREEWVATTVYFHGFANLPHESGSYVTSSNFHCLGHKWLLDLYPRGVTDNKGGVLVEEMVSLFLWHAEGGTIDIEYRFDVQGFTWEKLNLRQKCVDFTKCGGVSLPRKDALTYLVKGSLVIVVWMKVASDDRTFVLSNPSSNVSFNHLFMDSKSADVVFKIGGESLTSSNVPSTKKQKTPKSIFFAHRCILMVAAPLLADMCMSSTDNKPPIVVELPKESARSFRALLRCIYGLNIFNVEKDVAYIKEILEVANKYGVVNLKLEAEDLLISSISLDIDNVIDYYLYAHDITCALLKETVMDFVTDNWEDVYASNRIADVPDGLRGSFENDMMTAMKIKSRADEALGTMRISELRQKAHNKGLDVDGTREALISLLN